MSILQVIPWKIITFIQYSRAVALPPKLPTPTASFPTPSILHSPISPNRSHHSAIPIRSLKLAQPSGSRGNKVYLSEHCRDSQPTGGVADRWRGREV
ncbi:hypothetical protein L873DRAFT_1809833 [Choiromyces venosus 120613-1]|uniref:Uncharacterized protein n=1 Tax=Choiromyces venosus 120613-1 TaxID=1336337 RepID=A0A3N4JJZ4_9PEZI|nr:hypothetical protein L873DRAFT_1809833 [Choiromyces venosus 120613-1]